jgi:two-component system response regulator NreC
MNTVSILLVDDHTIVRKGLRLVIDNAEGYEVVCEADNGRDAVKMVKNNKPDIVLMDLSMPQLNGLEASRQIRDNSPETNIIILTRHVNEEYVFEAISIGASGYILKRAAPKELIMALEAVYDGETYFSPSVATLITKKINRNKSITSKGSYSSITSREREVLQLIAEGHTNQSIADILYISSKTVENHRSSIKEKLNLTSTADLTKYAIKHGITDINI